MVGWVAVLAPAGVASVSISSTPTCLAIRPTLLVAVTAARVALVLVVPAVLPTAESSWLFWLSGECMQ